MSALVRVCNEMGGSAHLQQGGLTRSWAMETELRLEGRGEDWGQMAVHVLGFSSGGKGWSVHLALFASASH